MAKFRTREIYVGGKSAGKIRMHWILHRNEPAKYIDRLPKVERGEKCGRHCVVPSIIFSSVFVETDDGNRFARIRGINS